MKVALTFPGCHRRGGVERVMVECANFLSDRHQAHVYAADWDDGVLEDSVTKHAFPADARHSITRLLSYDRAQSREFAQVNAKYDAVAGFGVPAPPEAVIWVQAVHAAWIEISREHRDWKGRLKQRLNLYHPLVLAMERRVYGRRRYRKLIALSQRVKDDLIRFYGVPDDDVVIIPNGFAPQEFNVARCAGMRVSRRAELGYQPEDRVVVFVANELERKGFGPLVRALAALEDPRVHLLAVGRLNPLAYAAEIARLGLSDRVRFTGPSRDVATFYAASDVFALPTQYEAWGLVVTEAMACGLPVLTSRLAGAAIAVREGETGALLDNPRSVTEIAAKLRPLLDGDHASRETIAESVAEYAWPRVLKRYESLLLQCAVQAAPEEAQCLSESLTR